MDSVCDRAFNLNCAGFPGLRHAESRQRQTCLPGLADPPPNRAA